jgi:hypothetical protein
MEFSQEPNAFTDLLCLHSSDHSTIFGTNRQSEPFRVQFDCGLWDVLSVTSRHVEILAQR